MKELLEKYIGRECIINGSSGSIKGVILIVNDGAVEIKLHKKLDRVNVMNINHIYSVTILN